MSAGSRLPPYLGRGAVADDAGGARVEDGRHAGAVEDAGVVVDVGHRRAERGDGLQKDVHRTVSSRVTDAW